MVFQMTMTLWWVWVLMRRMMIYRLRSHCILRKEVSLT
jgi:hypothetical protein